MTKTSLQYSELRSLDSTIEQLQELVDGLRAGVVSLRRGEQRLLLEPGAVLDMTLSGEREGVQERFTLTLSWRRRELALGNDGPAEGAPVTPRSMPAPARELALRTEAERLFDEDESEAPLSSDDDHTLGPDDVDAPARANALGSEPPIDDDVVDDQAETVRHSSPPEGRAVQVAGDLGGPPSDAALFQRLYEQARLPAADGRLRLDEQRFASSLAALRLEPELERELRNLARQADAEGRERLFGQRSISELIASALSGAA